MRYKNRYLIFRIFRSDKRKQLDSKQKIQRYILDQVQFWFGDFTVASGFMSGATFQVKYYNPITNHGILKCAAKFVGNIRWLMQKESPSDTKDPEMESSRFNQNPFELLTTSGTLRVCQVKILEMNRKFIQQNADKLASSQSKSIDILMIDDEKEIFGIAV